MGAQDEIASLLQDALAAVADDKGCAPEDLATPLVSILTNALLSAYQRGMECEAPTVKTLIPKRPTDESEKR